MLLWCSRWSWAKVFLATAHLFFKQELPVQGATPIPLRLHTNFEWRSIAPDLDVQVTVVLQPADILKPLLTTAQTIAWHKKAQSFQFKTTWAPPLPSLALAVYEAVHGPNGCQAEAEKLDGWPFLPELLTTKIKWFFFSSRKHRDFPLKCLIKIGLHNYAC